MANGEFGGTYGYDGLMSYNQTNQPPILLLFKKRRTQQNDYVIASLLYWMSDRYRVNPIYVLYSTVIWR